MKRPVPDGVTSIYSQDYIQKHRPKRKNRSRHQKKQVAPKVAGDSFEGKTRQHFEIKGKSEIWLVI